MTMNVMKMNRDFVTVNVVERRKPLVTRERIEHWGLKRYSVKEQHCQKMSVWNWLS
jgi:hypothetical protein